MRQIKAIHFSVYEPIADLQTFRPMPTQSLQSLDPFLFLNHHGPQVYPPNNRGLPFGPHPHRGFETLTYIFQGDIMHWDSSGTKSVIEAGGIQWMTAGSGLIHSEESSAEFKQNGGPEEVIQLWLNLPAKYKMVPPQYHGLSKADIPVIELDEGRVQVKLISGEWNGQKGPIDSLTDLTMTSIDLAEGATLTAEIPADHQLLFYVVHGEVEVNGQIAQTHELVEFEFGESGLRVQAQAETRLIVGHGKPFNEPIVAHGPFVMNSMEEIQEAFADYRAGKLGSWEG